MYVCMCSAVLSSDAGLAAHWVQHMFFRRRVAMEECGGDDARSSDQCMRREKLKYRHRLLSLQIGLQIKVAKSQ